MMRAVLAPFDLWARDAKAWARRDRIEAILVQLETNPPTATKEDPTALIRLSEELREWWQREKAFVRDYPVPVPEDWTRREPARSSPRRSLKRV
jgi:hypothetical protein